MVWDEPRAWNCLGRASVDRGHKRVPEPPDITAGMSLIVTNASPLFRMNVRPIAGLRASAKPNTPCLRGLRTNVTRARRFPSADTGSAVRPATMTARPSGHSHQDLRFLKSQPRHYAAARSSYAGELAAAGRDFASSF